MNLASYSDLNKTTELTAVGGGLFVTDNDKETRLDWADVGGGTYKPAYVGVAPEAALTSATSWMIQRFTWTDVGGGTWKPTRIQTAEGAWDDRVALFS